MDSKGLKMPVSQSNKMEVSILERRLSEKPEHLPIKKRKFVFVDSSPPLNTASSEGTASVAACHQSSSQEVHLKPDASCPPSTSLTVAKLHESTNTDSKLDVEKLVMSSKKANNDLGGDANLYEGSRVVSNDKKSLQPPGTVEFKAQNVKLENMSAKGTDFHLSTVPAKDVAPSMMNLASDKATVCNSTPGESTLYSSCSQAPSESEHSKINHVASNKQKYAALDDRLNWDLNTVMAWEETLESDHNMSSKKEGKSEGYGKEREGGSAKNIGNEISLVGLKSLTPKVEKPELDECKPGFNGSSRLLSPVFNSVPRVIVSNLNSLQNQHADSSTNAIPVSVPSALTLKYPACTINAKHVDVMAAGANLSLEHTVPPSFERGHASEKNVVSSRIIGSGSNVSHAVNSGQAAENAKLNLSLVTAPSLENGVHQSGSTFDDDDKTKVKRITTSNGMTIENLIGKGRSEITQNVVSSKSVGSGNLVNHSITTLQTTENEKLKLSLVTFATTENGVHQSASTFDEDDKAQVKRAITSNRIMMDDQPAAVSSTHDVCSDPGVPLQPGKSTLTGTIYDKSCDSHVKHPNDLVNYNNEVYDYENFPSDIQAGSEVDNVDELSYGYDSQFEDGEFRDSSIQTWEGDEGEYRDIEEEVDNQGAFGTHENGSQCALESSSRIRSTDVGSQKGTDEISSVLLPEKLDSSDQISGSELNVTETGITEVSMKDVIQSDQWKMNVSGSDILPENHRSSCDITKMKDFSSNKSSSRINGDLETKAEGSRLCRKEPSTLEAVLCRSRFRMQGSSSTDADDSTSRSLRDSGVLRSTGRGKYIRGGGMWNRSPPFSRHSFRRTLLEDVASAENLTNKVGVDPGITRQSFRSRLMVNREEDEFRARLGLRPSGDTIHSRFVNAGRGRSLRYGSRTNDGGPRGRYYGPANDEYAEPSMEYSRSFPNRQRRENHLSSRHHSGSTSPTTRTRPPIIDGFRHRSRSPNLRDTRIRRPRSPNYRGHGFEANHVGGYILEPRDNNNSPPTSRWLKYKQRPFVFDRRSPPAPIGDRLSFYESSRKPKQKENFSSRFSEFRGDGRGGGGRYLESDDDVPDLGYRRGGGFIRPYDVSRPVKHIPYGEVDGYGPPVYDSHDKESLEFHGRGNHKPYVNGTDSRFRDIPKRAREDRENW